MMSLWQRIAALARKDPARIAIVGERNISYGELAGAVESAASQLLGYCGPGDVIAVQAQSLPGIISILVALRLGAAFLPLDTEAPSSRQDYVLQNAGAKVVASRRSDRLGDLTFRFMGRCPPSGSAVPKETAYVIYTSGSTGLPKGVMISEEALLSRLDGLACVPGCSAESSILALTALSFDISLAEFLLPLNTGGRLVMAHPSARIDPDRFDATVSRYKPDIIQATPSFWRLMLVAGWRGAKHATIWCGGEALSDHLAQELSALCRELWNMYGPTEATVWSNAWRITPDKPVSLGSALPGSACCLVGYDGRIITESGHDGEIVLGGAGLALGYVGNPTEQNRFTCVPGFKQRAYLTGDRGRYRADGSLEFLGRRDTQVKFHGHRLELGEVEAAIEAHPDVRDAVVFLCNEDDLLRAHLTAIVAAPAAMTDYALRDWLADRVPRIMVPKRILVWHQLPRTTAGKIDRMALRISAVSAAADDRYAG